MEIDAWNSRQKSPCDISANTGLNSLQSHRDGKALRIDQNLRTVREGLEGDNLHSINIAGAIFRIQSQFYQSPEEYSSAFRSNKAHSLSYYEPFPS